MIFLCVTIHTRKELTLTEKLFLTANQQKKLIFLSCYFYVLFSVSTPSEKYFSIGIRIFCRFLTEVIEIPVVWVLYQHGMACKLYLQTVVKEAPLLLSL
jgi:hypothetical protein